MKKIIVIILVLIIIAGAITGFNFYKANKEKQAFYNMVYNTVYNENGDIKSYTFKGTSTQAGNIIQSMELYYDGVNMKTLENYKSGEDGYTEYKEIVTDKEITYSLTNGDDTWFKQIYATDEYGISDRLSGQVPDMAIILEAKTVKQVEENVYQIEYDKKYLEEMSSEDETVESVVGKVYIESDYVVKVELETISSNLEIKRISTKLVFELSDINSTVVGIPDDIKKSAEEVVYEE